MAEAPTAFTEASTAAEVIDAYSVNLEGKVVFITGTSSGIGIETAREMLRAGATVVGAVRNVEKMEPIAAELKESTGNDKLEILQCNLADLDTVRECAKQFLAKYEQLDLLICNAGVMATAGRRETAQGFEFQFGVNHVGHFLLVTSIADTMRGREGARLVVLSSTGHKFGGINFDDVQMSDADNYNKWAAYGQSKTANIMFAREFSNRYGIPGYAVHPGLVQTNLAHELTQEDFALFGSMPTTSLLKNPQQGAATTVYAAVSPDLNGTSFAFLADCAVVTDALPEGMSVQESFGLPAIAHHVATTENDERLWTLSEELVKLPEEEASS